jgi:hypothetical protein
MLQLWQHIACVKRSAICWQKSTDGVDVTWLIRLQSLSDPLKSRQCRLIDGSQQEYSKHWPVYREIRFEHASQPQTIRTKTSLQPETLQALYQQASDKQAQNMGSVGAINATLQEL